ncbi:hypothetical protein CHARACLAT_023806 [Characodon lateralis]|uniref:Uncharacterized protein n=1 Tax=Characodon lateralis TaxID=208331 RepID=A0ABU7D092_9TELE|nr:hypothetical protein [Characodon lateralis]
MKLSVPVTLFWNIQQPLGDKAIFHIKTHFVCAAPKIIPFCHTACQPPPPLEAFLGTFNMRRSTGCYIKANECLASNWQSPWVFSSHCSVSMDALTHNCIIIIISAGICQSSDSC